VRWLEREGRKGERENKRVREMGRKRKREEKKEGEKR